MAIILNGTTHVLQSASFGASRPAAYSIACWWRGDATGGAGGGATLLSVGNTLGNPSDRGDLLLLWNFDFSINCRAAIHTTGTTYPATNTAGTTTSGIWLHHCATYAATRLKFHQNGAQVGATTNATVSAASPADWVVDVGNGSGNSQRVAGRVCMIGYWDVELTADEVAALGKGFSPRHIRPQSLRYFIPGLRDPNAVIGTTNTATNLTYTDDNPRIIW